MVKKSGGVVESPTERRLRSKSSGGKAKGGGDRCPTCGVGEMTALKSRRLCCLPGPWTLQCSRCGFSKPLEKRNP